MPVDSQTELERKPLSHPESLRVRCPHCRKLYLVQYNDIQEAKPRFECVACRDRFWISLSDMDFSTEVDGIPVQVKTPPLKTAFQLEPCPKCLKMTPKSNVECIHCGVVLNKVKELEFKEALPPHSMRLQAAWQQVIADYGDSKRHDDFIRASQAEGNLQYAGALYSQMQKLMPLDDVTKKRLAQIKALATLLEPERRAAPAAWHSTSRLWQIPLMGGVICLMVGLALPSFRNIAGVGAAFLFLAFALRRR